MLMTAGMFISLIGGYCYAMSLKWDGSSLLLFKTMSPGRWKSAAQSGWKRAVLISIIFLSALFLFSGMSSLIAPPQIHDAHRLASIAAHRSEVSKLLTDCFKNPRSASMQQYHYPIQIASVNQQLMSAIFETFYPCICSRETLI